MRNVLWTDHNQFRQALDEEDGFVCSFDSDAEDGLQAGMEFVIATTAHHAARDFALAQGRSVKPNIASGMNRRIVCMSLGCSFAI